jgi:hypothetical protein
VSSLLLVVVLSALAAGGFSMIESERKALTDHEALSDAYNMARSAFDRFMANSTGSLPSLTNPAWTGPDSVQFTFPSGHAWVMVQQVRPAIGGDQALYLVRSRAVRTTYLSGNTPAAERIFAQYARWETGSIPTPAAWTSLSGLLKNGGSGVISGADACGASTPVAGVGVPNVPGYVQVGGTSVPTGSPPILNMGSQAAAQTTVASVDWPSIVDGTKFVPDYIFPGSSWPTFSDATFWPAIYVDEAGEWSLPTSGRGILVVKNDLKLGGSVEWDGIILVGGHLTSSGNNTVSGVIISGLNTILGQVVPPSDIGNGTKIFKYNSCSVASALAHFTGLRALRNTTVDNWPSY